MIFFSLITTAFSSIFYGVIVTTVIMAILYAVLKGISRSMVETPVFYIAGVALAVLLVIQNSLMIGAIQAMGVVDAVDIYLNQLLENASGTIGVQDSQDIMDKVIEKFPIIGSYIGMADFTGHDVSELANTMCQAMKDYLSSYIWHRAWWILGIVVVACLIVMLFDKRDTAPRPHTKGRVTSQKDYDDF